MSILNLCMERKAKVFAVKEGYELGDNINSKVLAFAFLLSAEIERNRISLRTKEALARLKSEGKKLGRPLGSKSVKTKTSSHPEFIIKGLAVGKTQCEIAISLNVYRAIKRWVSNRSKK